MALMAKFPLVPSCLLVIKVEGGAARCWVSKNTGALLERIMKIKEKGYLGVSYPKMGFYDQLQKNNKKY